MTGEREREKVVFNQRHSIACSSSSDSSYLICSKIENCLNEEILFDHQRIEPNQSSLITSKQEKIPLKTFPSDLSQLLNVIRSVLPTHLHYRTVHSVSNRVDFRLH